jgi:hypothetical protein
MKNAEWLTKNARSSHRHLHHVRALKLTLCSELSNLGIRTCFEFRGLIFEFCFGLQLQLSVRRHSTNFTELRTTLRFNLQTNGDHIGLFRGSSYQVVSWSSCDDFSVTDGW